MLVLTVIQLALSFFFFLSQSVMTSSFLTFLFIGLTFFSLSTHHSSSLWLGWVRIYVFTPFCVAREENMLSCWEEMDVKKGLLWCHTHAGGVTADEHSKLLRNTNTHTHTHTKADVRFQSSRNQEVPLLFMKHLEHIPESQVPMATLNQHPAHCLP